MTPSLFLFHAAAAHAATVVAFTDATVHTGTGQTLQNATVIVSDGKITAVGDVEVPSGADVRPMTGKVIIPGLVDTHSHIGTTGDLFEGSGPVHPEISSVDAIDVSLPALARARAGGITTVNVMPGSGNLVGGQTAYLKLREGTTIDALLICEDRRDDLCGGMKMANGTNSRSGAGPYPHTRMASAAMQRQLFLDARKFIAQKPGSDKKKKKKDDAGSPTGPRDLAKDPVVEILEGDRIVHFHTHRADDIATALRLAEEFDLPMVLHHVSEAWKMVPEIAASGLSVSLIVVDSPGGKEEATEIRLENAARMHEAGVLFSLHTDDPITDSRQLLRSGGLAIRDGLPESAALQGLTLNPAKQLGLDARLGSLEVGKDADLVVLSGPPFSVWTHVEQTWVEGQKVFDRSDPADRVFATGGDRVFDRHPAPGGE